MRKRKHVSFIIFSLLIFIASIVDTVPKASAKSVMNASEACIDFIKNVEGFSPEPYYDYNQYTVGYGTKCPTEKFFEYKANGIPKAEADILLQEAVEGIEEAIGTKLITKYDLTLTQNQFDALVSFSFNIGTNWLTYDSTLRNAILRNASDNDLVYAFGLYCTAGGEYLSRLVTRRLCEANIYLNGTYRNTVSTDYGYVYYDSNGGTMNYRVQCFLCDDAPSPVSDVARTGDVFLGWYTELTGGTQVTSLTHAVNGKTLFARWQSSENATQEDIASTTVRVIGDVVNIRKGPGTNYGVLKQVYRNTILSVSHITHLTTMRWGKVQDGWISLDYTNYDDVINGEDPWAPGETEESADNDSTAQEDNQNNTEIDNKNSESVWGTVRVNDLLRIRSGPGMDYTVVGFLFNDKEVEILEQKKVGSMNWGRISRGWVSMDYIITDVSDEDERKEPIIEEKDEEIPESSPDEPLINSESTKITGIIRADALRIRADAGTSYPILGFYYENDNVTVYEKKLVDSVYWGLTNKGWINMDYVVIDSDQEETPQPEDGQIMTVIGDCLRVRKGTGTDYKIAAFLYYGDKITVFETVDVNGVLWGRVKNGWICMDYVA